MYLENMFWKMSLPYEGHQTRSSTLATLHSNPSHRSSSTNSNLGAMTPPVAAVEMTGPQRFPSQRPYKYGMVLLCLGALINWLGLAENYIEPVRYIGVACIVTGAMLIIAAMCCWMNTNTPTPPQVQNDSNMVHVIEINEHVTGSAASTKPPDYDSVVTSPPSYDVAIKLNPTLLLVENQSNPTRSQNVH